MFKVTIKGKGFGKLDAPIPCPNCNRKFNFPIAKMRPGTSTKCPSCGAVIDFKGDDGAKVQRAFDDLEKTIRNLGR
jgi:hypothetical protein